MVILKVYVCVHVSGLRVCAVRSQTWATVNTGSSLSVSAVPSVANWSE